MSTLEVTVAAFRREGRRAALAGVPIDQNPAQSRTAGSDGVLDSDKAWNAKKAAWQLGHDEGTAERASR